MTYRSSAAQLANLQRKQPKSDLVRDAHYSIKISSQRKEILRNQLKAEGMTLADFLEAVATRIEREGITIEGILKN